MKTNNKCLAVIPLGELKDILGSELYVIVQLFGYFLFALCGSFIKESYNNYINKKEKIETIKIVISTVISVTITYMIKEYFFQDEQYRKLCLSISLILGILGFEIFTKISTVEGLKSLSMDIHIIIKNLFFPFSDSDNNKKQNNEKK